MYDKRGGIVNIIDNTCIGSTDEEKKAREPQIRVFATGADTVHVRHPTKPNDRFVYEKTYDLALEPSREDKGCVAARILNYVLDEEQSDGE